MAKQKKDIATETTEGEERKAKSGIDEPVDGKKVVYSFPTQSKCPRCGTTETTAYSTKGKVQYRRCLRAICRWNYQVIGQKV